MATLAGQRIKDSYGDILQVSNSNDGADGTLRAVEDGKGDATALKVSTGAIQVDNIKIDGNTISSTDTNGAINLTPHGSGAVVLADGATATTQSAGNNTTKVATTAYVDAQVGTENTLLEMDDVTITSIADNDIIAYNSASSKYINQSAAEVGVATIASPTFTGTIGIPNIANLENAVAANTAKNTNVSTNLGVSASGSAFTVTSSDGDNASLTLADTDNWGVMSDEMFDKLNGVETSADVTDATNVTAAGALMDSEVTNLAFVKALAKGIGDGNVLTANDVVANDDFLRINGTEVEGLTVAEVLTALSVESGADITDATNVVAAGALMDSEVDADIKTLSLPASTTISTFGASLVDDAAASNARTTLGLGTSAVLSTASIANGGTGVATADQIHTFVTTQTDAMGAGTSGNAATSTLASTATVTDSTANTNFPVVFHNESNGLLDDTGALRYNPSTGELLVPKLTVAGTTTTVDTVTMNAANAVIFEGATADAYETTLSIVDPTADHTQYLINQGGYIPLLAALTTTAITATPAELNIMDAGTVQATVTLVDGDGVVISDGTVMKQALVSDFGTHAVAAVVTADNYLKNDASDTTSGTITAGGFTTTGTWTFDEATSGTVGITTVQDSGTAFADNDTSFLTAAAAKDYVDSNSATAGFATAMAIAL